MKFIRAASIVVLFAVSVVHDVKAARLGEKEIGMGIENDDETFWARIIQVDQGTD